MGGRNVGETVGACFCVPASIGADCRKFGLIASVGSAEAPAIALLFPCEGSGVSGTVKGGAMVADGGVDVVFFSDICAIGLPH